ncbi:MAG TPA: PaaI family thioesterase [Candidatus Scatomorpha merdigallinarum]|nr:PaaI family thioesterase [Candidatus Scatomorpha merdigallinarum]
MKKKIVRKHKNSGNCFVCGINNEFGLHASFYELEDGSIVGLVNADPRHQSYPGRVHGGVICAMLDETMGRAINVTEPDTWGVTGDINIRYRHPVPYGVPLIVTGRITRNSRLLFNGEGEIILPDGTVAATGSARYMKQPLAVIGDLASNGDIWELIQSPDDPTEIDIPELKK